MKYRRSFIGSKIDNKLKEINPDHTKYSLLDIEFRNFDTSQVTNMSWMFHGCEKLEVLDLSSFNTSKVIDMSYMFYECLNLRELDTSNFETHKVKRMNGMFEYCPSLPGEYKHTKY